MDSESILIEQQRDVGIVSIAVSGSPYKVVGDIYIYIVPQLAVYATYIPLINLNIFIYIANWVIIICYRSHLLWGTRFHSIDISRYFSANPNPLGVILERSPL